MPTADVLIRHPLFSGAPSGVVRGVVRDALSRIPVHEQAFATGQVVAFQGDRIDRLSIIVAGKLAATMESPAGRSLMVETLGAPEVLAPGLLAAAEPRLPVTLTAVAPGRLASLPLDRFWELCERFPSVYRNLMAMAAEKFAFVTTKMRLLHFASLRQKTAGYLLELMQHGGPSPTRGTVVTLPYTRERLAELFGVARPSLSRVLGELAEEGVLSISRSQVRIPDRRELMAVLDEER